MSSSSSSSVPELRVHRKKSSKQHRARSLSNNFDSRALSNQSSHENQLQNIDLNEEDSNQTDIHQSSTAYVNDEDYTGQEVEANDFEEEHQIEKDQNLGSMSNQRNSNNDIASNSQIKMEKLKKKRRKKLKKEKDNNSRQELAEECLDQSLEVIHPVTHENVYIHKDDMIKKYKKRRSDRSNGDSIDFMREEEESRFDDEFENMATTTNDTFKKVGFSDIQAKFYEDGKHFRRMDSDSDTPDSRSKKNDQTAVTKIAWEFDKLSRFFLQSIHNITAGICLASLILLPISDLGPSLSTLISEQNLPDGVMGDPLLFRGHSIPSLGSDATTIPSPTQIFLAYYSENAMPISWIFNILLTLSLVNVMEFVFDPSKNLDMFLGQLKNRRTYRQSRLQSKRDTDLLIFKVTAILVTVIALISTFLLIPIDDALTSSQTDVLKGTNIIIGPYGQKNWFFYKKTLSESIFESTLVMKTWVTLNIVRDVFGILSWVVLTFGSFLFKEKIRQYDEVFYFPNKIQLKRSRKEIEIESSKTIAADEEV